MSQHGAADKMIRYGRVTLVYFSAQSKPCFFTEATKCANLSANPEAFLPVKRTKIAHIKLSVGVAGNAYLLEIDGLFTHGSRPGRTVGDSVGGIF